MNEAIKRMKKIQGLHAVSTPFAWAIRGMFAIVFVDTKRDTVHQVDPETGALEEELTDDGWDGAAFCLELKTLLTPEDLAKVE